MLYIRRIRVAMPGTGNRHITAVQYSSSPTGTLAEASVDTMVRLIDHVTEVRSHNDRTGAQALVRTRSGTSGRKFITTMADGAEANNLLELPRF